MIRSRGTPVNAEARAMHKVNLAEAFASFSDPWNPRIAGDINSFQVKLVKLAGAFDWHHHEVEDELFLVVAGRMRLGLRDRDVDLEAGEFIIVPHGVEHRPEALTDECQVLLLEPASTLNTGETTTERTRGTLDRIA
jgi:mannose-6-phosphate isomerase-like protein (cupin superfamily)